MTIKVSRKHLALTLTNLTEL